MTNTALLLIDVQVNMFAQGSSVFDGEKVLNTISSLITRARSTHLPIFYVQNNGGENDPDLPGTPGWQIHPAVTPEKEDIIIQKSTPDSFFQTNLQNELDSRHIRRLIIAGMQTDFCINATCRRAFDFGYDVTLVQDGHSTYDGGHLTASQIIFQYNDELIKMVNVKEAKDIPFA
jgi:nicotinamidase-related amidase